MPRTIGAAALLNQLFGMREIVGFVGSVVVVRELRRRGLVRWSERDRCWMADRLEIIEAGFQPSLRGWVHLS